MKTRLANLIKTKRKELKLSQKALAEGICTQTIISRIEKGEITPSVDIFFKIIKKLCIPMEDVANLFSLDMTNVKDLSFDFYELEEMLVKRDYKTLSVLLKSINMCHCVQSLGQGSPELSHPTFSGEFRLCLPDERKGTESCGPAPPSPHVKGRLGGPGSQLRLWGSSSPSPVGGASPSEEAAWNDVLLASCLAPASKAAVPVW